MALIKCPECGKSVSDKASNCPECGYPIYLTVNEAFEKKKCRYCGIMNEHYANVCTGCGAALEAAEEKNDSVKSPVILEDVIENGTFVCDVCGFSMPTDVDTCLNCGNRLIEDDEVVLNNDLMKNVFEVKNDRKNKLLFTLSIISIVLGTFFFLVIIASEGGIGNNTRMFGSAWFLVIAGSLGIIGGNNKKFINISVGFYFLGALYNLYMITVHSSNLILCVLSLVFAILILRGQNKVMI